MALSRRRVLQMALAPVILRRPQVQDPAPTTSRVYPGTNNKLIYVPDELGNTIIDSSHAGYGGGGVANTVFWNCEGGFLVQKPPTAQNFSFGHPGVNAVVFNIPLQDPAKENGASNHWISTSCRAASISLN